MRIGRARRSAWWAVVPMFALLVAPRRASGQTCGSTIDATLTIVDMMESGGVGLRVRTTAEEALRRFTEHPDATGAWPADTSMWVGRAAIRIETPRPSRDALPTRMLITVVLPD